jgi:hypothetical protein
MSLNKRCKMNRLQIWIRNRIHKFRIQIRGSGFLKIQKSYGPEHCFKDGYRYRTIFSFCNEKYGPEILMYVYFWLGNSLLISEWQS